MREKKKRKKRDIRLYAATYYLSLVSNLSCAPFIKPIKQLSYWEFLEEGVATSPSSMQYSA